MSRYIKETLNLSGTRERYTFLNENKNGETIVVDMAHGYASPKSRTSLPARWKSAGYTKKLLTSWINVDVYVTDAKGNCYNKYNPTIADRVINFDWMIEDTPENRQRMLEEIERRAFN